MAMMKHPANCCQLARAHGSMQPFNGRKLRFQFSALTSGSLLLPVRLLQLPKLSLLAAARRTRPRTDSRERDLTSIFAQSSRQFWAILRCGCHRTPRIRAHLVRPPLLLLTSKLDLPLLLLLPPRLPCLHTNTQPPSIHARSDPGACAPAVRTEEPPVICALTGRDDDAMEGWFPSNEKKDTERSHSSYHACLAHNRQDRTTCNLAGR